MRDLVLGGRAVAVEAQDAAGGVGGHAQVALALAQLRKRTFEETKADLFSELWALWD